MTNNLIKKTMDELERKSSGEHKTAVHFPIWLLLDDVRSMHNVGAIFRTADAFNVSGVYLCGFTPAPPHRDIHKTALGATESVVWHYEKHIEAILKRLRNEGYKIYAVEQTHNSMNLQNFQPDASAKSVFIFGNEVSGVNDTALQYCDAAVEIPQWGSKHSLNISVSAGVVLWEIVRKL